MPVGINALNPGPAVTNSANVTAVVSPSAYTNASVTSGALAVYGLDTTGAISIASAANASIINAAMAIQAAAGGGTVLLPAGTISITAYLSIPSNVILKGMGRGVTRIVPIVAASLDPVSAGAITMMGVHDSAVEDLTLDMSAKSDGGDGIVFAPVASASLPNTITYDTLTGTFLLGEFVTGGTSGATAFVIYDSGSTMVLYNPTGTFKFNETITGKQSGATCRHRVTAGGFQNPASYRCYAKRCEVIGYAFKGLQYLIWSTACFDIHIEQCVVNGNSITESGATEFAFDTAQIDQNGIEVLGGYNVKITNCLARYMAGVGIQAIAASGVWINNENILIHGNTVEGCSVGIAASADFQSSTVLALKNVIVSNNQVLTSWRYGMFVGCANVTSNTVGNNVIIANNTVDLSASKRSTTYGCFALKVTAASGAALWKSCKVIGNTFRGGGGKGASSIINSTINILFANGWTFENNTVDSVDDVNTESSMQVNSSNDVVVQGNTFSNNGSRAFKATASLRLTVTGNSVWPLNSRNTTCCMEFLSSCHNLTLTNNTFDANGITAAILGADNGNNVECYGNIFKSGTVGFFSSSFPWVDESGFGTGTARTHGFGKFTPANATTTFTIPNTRINLQSTVQITQIAAGGVAAIPTTCTITQGQVIVNGVFLGTSAFSYRIIN
jgi:hypothetical protein